MNIKRKELKLSPSYMKIIETVSYLNERHFYPLPEGIGKILKGEKDDETLQFVSCPTYATLISFPSKKICRYVMMLTRYGYLDKIYDQKTNTLYLRTTDLGESTLFDYKKKHKRAFTKRTLNKKVTIVHI